MFSFDNFNSRHRAAIASNVYLLKLRSKLHVLKILATHLKIIATRVLLLQNLIVRNLAEVPFTAKFIRILPFLRIFLYPSKRTILRKGVFETENLNSLCDIK